MSKLTVLLTNDDGIDAPGLAAMEHAFSLMDDVEVWTVAPDGQRSACSHGMTLHRPSFVRECGPRRFATSGLTADCVYFGLFGCLPQRPGVVVSGINAGPNLGTDVIYSGTVAGAREAAVRGIHGVAASLVQGNDYSSVAASVAGVAVQLADSGQQDVRLVNLNYPMGEFSRLSMATLGKRVYPHRVESREAPSGAENYYWLGGPPVEDQKVPGTDGWCISRGMASATFLALDQSLNTHAPGGELLSCLGIEEAPEQ